MDDDRALQALRAEAVLVDPLGKDLIVARGADRVRFLNGVVTGNVAATPVGGGVHALLLTPKAHVVSELRVFVRAEDILLVVAGGQGATAAASLSRYAVMDDFSAEVAEEEDFLAVLGPRAAACLERVGVSPDALARAPLWSHVTVGTRWLARVVQLGVEGFWIAAPKRELDGLRAALASEGTPRLSPETAEAARIIAREPAWGQEITDEFFPMEIGLTEAIDYGKGCFLGQEPIVRIRDRGHVNWRLVALEVEGVAGGGAALEAGDRLESDSKPKAGKITSVGRWPDGRQVALAVVHVSVPEGATVRVLGAAGAAKTAATVH